MKVDIKNITIRKAHEGMKNRLFSAWELCSSFLEIAKEKNPETNAFLEIFDDVKQQAEDVDLIIRNSSRVDLEKTLHPLAGIPIAIKDNILIKGRRSSAASRILEGHTAVYDATVIDKLKSCRAVFMGRTNMDEFAMGSSTENSAFGVTSNPYDMTRVSGGSSGGSAASVALGMALAALGSDTGGSVRQPASFCGVYGMKPTYGYISRYGLMALASSLDQIGPFARNIDDLEIIYHAIEGHDPFDATSLSVMRREVLTSGAVPSSLVIGVPYDFLKEGVDQDVLDLFNLALGRLKEKGHQIVPVDLPYVRYSLPVYYIVMPAEASANLARYDGVRYGYHEDGKTIWETYKKTRGQGFGEEVRRRILLGTYVLSAGYYDAYYKKAIAVKDLITADFLRVFGSGDLFGRSVHAIATPTAPTPAFKIGEKVSDPLSMYLADVFTVPANIAGIPALSVPSGSVSRDGKELPAGVQFMTSHGREDYLFKLARELDHA